MPSQRKQINFRADAETVERMERLQPIVKQALGIDVSVADLIRLGLIELEKRYDAAAPAGAETASADAAPKRGMRKAK